MRRMILLALVFLLAACGQMEVAVQLMEPTEATAFYQQQATEMPNEDNRLLYTHESTGMQFLYPAAWQVQGADGIITVSGEGVRLAIEYMRLSPEQLPIVVRENINESIVEDRSLRLLGDLHPTYRDDESHMLYYTSPKNVMPVYNFSFAPFIVANIGFAIRLESEQWPIPPTLREQTDALVESFGFVWLVTRPDDATLTTWQLYTDDETGLQFLYPPAWEVTRTPDAIIVKSDAVQLILSLESGPPGLSAGDLRKGEPTHVWLNGTAVPRVHLVYAEKTKAVYYGPPITQLTLGDHTLIISVTDTGSVPYDDVDLSADTLRQMDWLLTTLTP